MHFSFCFSHHFSLLFKKVIYTHLYRIYSISWKSTKIYVIDLLVFCSCCCLIFSSVFSPLSMWLTKPSISCVMCDWPADVTYVFKLFLGQSIPLHPRNITKSLEERQMFIRVVSTRVPIYRGKILQTLFKPCMWLTCVWGSLLFTQVVYWLTNHIPLVSPAAIFNSRRHLFSLHKYPWFCIFSLKHICSFTRSAYSHLKHIRGFTHSVYSIQ